MNVKTVIVASFFVFWTPSAGRAQQASAADTYRAAVDAFTEGDSARYFGAFVPELRCFYERRAVPLDRVRAERAPAIEDNRRAPGAHPLVVEHLDEVFRSDDALVLRDIGRFEGVFHEKVVLMMRRDGQWRIAGEGGPGTACYVELLRRQTLNGVDPLASEDAIWRALQQANDLPEGLRAVDFVEPGRGVVRVRRSSNRSDWTGCQTPDISLPSDLRREALRCDEGLSRCVLARRVFRFAERAGRRQWVAVVEYDGDPVPPHEPDDVERMIGERDRICELHDRLVPGDLMLATDDLWVLQADIDGTVSARHLCGRRAERRARLAIGMMRRTPLTCGELECSYLVDSNQDPHVYARREDGALHLSVDATSWVLGTNVPRRIWRRTLDERCGRAAPPSPASQ